jgi:hypothetical protein
MMTMAKPLTLLDSGYADFFAANRKKCFRNDIAGFFSNLLAGC